MINKFFLVVVLFSLVGCTNNIANKKEEPMVKQSETFRRPVTFGDGTKGEIVLLGIKGKVEMQIGSGPMDNVQVDQITANKIGTYMWYFWLEEEKKELVQRIEIIGINMTTKEEIVIGNANVSVIKNPYLMRFNTLFPKSGMWKLQALINQELFAEIFVDVKN